VEEGDHPDERADHAPEDVPSCSSACAVYSSRQGAQSCFTTRRSSGITPDSHNLIGRIARRAREEYIRGTLRVAFVTCVLTGLLVAGTACGGATDGNGGEAASGRDPHREIQADAQERAESIVLKLSDFPEGWRASSSDENDSAGRERFQQCADVDLSSLALNGKAESKDFTEEGSATITTYSSRALVYESQGQAEKAIDELTAATKNEALGKCVRSSLEESGEKDSKGEKVEWGEVTVSKLSLMPLDVDETAGLRLVMPFETTDREGGGIVADLTLDGIQLREGDTVASLGLFYYGFSEVDLGLRNRLLRVIAERMTAAD